MKKLESIELQNFKAFGEQITIPIEGKNVLGWGVNGSGKSSVYWALYTFLQCSRKDTNTAKKYFDKGDESLHNLFSDDIESYIKLNFKELNNDIESYVLSLNQNDTKNEFISAINASSEFITHRLLLNFYNYRNSQKIDLFPIFDRDIFPYFNTSSGQNFNALLNNVRNKLNSESKKNIDSWVMDFNNGLEDLLFDIKRGGASEFYNKNLACEGQKIDIKITFEQALAVTGNKGNRKFVEPLIRLQAKIKHDGLDEEIVKRPQTFFNEARINAIALSIRFVLMENRSNPENLQLLVLDDLLISLDMQNRVKIIRLILDKYQTDYQIMIFTHDKAFYKLMLREIESDLHNWKVMQFYESDSPNKSPVIKYANETYLNLAKNAYLRKDFDSCALHLRKETEEILKKFLDPDMNLFWNQLEWKDLSGFIKSAKKRFYTIEQNAFQRLVDRDISIEYLEKLKGNIEGDPTLVGDMQILGPLLSYKKEVFNYIIRNKSGQSEGNDIYNLLLEIDKIKDRVLNPAAHATEAPLFDGEIQVAIEKVKELKQKLKSFAEDGN